MLTITLILNPFIIYLLTIFKIDTQLYYCFSKVPSATRKSLLTVSIELN